MENIFMTATRNKYRFTYHGSLTVEDLWDLSTKDLDNIFKSLNREVKIVNEDSLFDSIEVQDEVLKNKIAIVRYIFETKVAEARANADAMAKKKQRERIMEVLAKKQDESLESRTEEELLVMLENL